MKRILSLLIIFAILAGNGAFAQANNPAVSRIVGFGIMQGDKNGDLSLEDGVTRAEFAAMVVRMLQLDDADLGVPPVFSDVTREHWAYYAVSALYGMGIVSGRSKDVFAPDDGVSFNEAVKILVAALGYDAIAAEAGEYPQGYLITAAGIGLFKGVKAKDGQITRATAASLINAALDVVPLKANIGRDGYERGNKTLYDYLVGENDIIKVRGIVTAVGNLTVEDEFDTKLKNGHMKIDAIGNKEKYAEYGGLIYKTAADYSEYLGMSVEGYAKYEESDDIYVIINLAPDKNNEIIAADAKDAELHGSYMEYSEGDGRANRKVTFAPDVTFIYNGRVIFNPTAEDMKIYYGQYRVLENDGDGLADIVFIDEAESYIVESARQDDIATALYLANKRTYRGSNRFEFDFDDSEKIYDIRDMDGNELKFEDIKPGMGITFMQSIDGNYTKIALSDKKVSGTVDGLGYDEDGVISSIDISGTEYKAALSTEGKNNIDIRIGDEGTYALDVYGSIIDIYGDKILSYEYAYVLDAQEGRSLDGNISLKIVQGTPPVVEETVTAGNTSYTYYFQNDLIKIYECDKKVKFKAQMAGNAPGLVDVMRPFETVKLSASDLVGSVIGFSKNAEGKIREIYVFPLPAKKEDMGSGTFNARNVSLGGDGLAGAVDRGYLTNSQTMFICVPDKPQNDEDYYVQIRMEDNSSSHYVYGARMFFSSVEESDEKRTLLNAQPVDFLVIKEDMDSSDPPIVPEGADVCMLVKRSKVVADTGINAGETVYKLELLDRDKVVTEYSNSSGMSYNMAENLIPGDLIRYNKDGFGRIARVELVGRIQGLGEGYYDINNETYGVVQDIKLNMFAYHENIMVDRLILNLGDAGTAEKKIPVEDGPAVYLYDRSREGWISSARTEDIVSTKQGGAGASRIFMYTNNDKVIKAVVIIK